LTIGLVRERPPDEDLYWNLAGGLFRPDVLVPDGRVCPFRGPSFQSMRNLALARAKSAPQSVRANRAAPTETVHSYWGMLVIHVASHKNAERHRAEFDQFRSSCSTTWKTESG
jgi:hypothetical protein